MNTEVTSMTENPSKDTEDEKKLMTLVEKGLKLNNPINTDDSVSEADAMTTDICSDAVQNMTVDMECERQPPDSTVAQASPSAAGQKNMVSSGAKTPRFKTKPLIRRRKRSSSATSQAWLKVWADIEMRSASYEEANTLALQSIQKSIVKMGDLVKKIMDSNTISRLRAQLEKKKLKEGGEDGDAKERSQD